MQYNLVATVRLLESRQPLPSVLIGLVLADQRGVARSISPRVMTNENGIAYITFDLSNIPDTISLSRRSTSLRLPSTPPSMNIQVYDQKGNVVQSNSLTMQRSQLPRSVSIRIPIETALKHKLLTGKTRPTPDQKKQTWVSHWREYMRKTPGPGPSIDLCLLQNVFKTLQGMENPSTELQEQARRLIEKRVKPDQWQAITGTGTDGLKLIESVRDQLGIKCPHSDLNEIANVLTGDDGPLGPIMHMFGGGTSLLDDLGTPKRGVPFTFPAVGSLEKDCLTRYENDSLPDDIRDAIKEILNEELHLVRPPSVNLVEVRQVQEQFPMLIREGNLHDKTLLVRDFDPLDGEKSVTVQMRVPWDSEDGLVMKLDPTDAEFQIMTVDIKPGQRVALWGSGFIADQAKLQVSFSRWQETPNEGRLVPQSTVMPVPSLSGMIVDVHSFGDSIPSGATPQSLNQDLIVFDWPTGAADAGLYQVQLEFENQSQFPSSIAQDPVTCEITRDFGSVNSQVFYFVVLPALMPRPVRARATRVECIDETDPESFGPINWFDDIDFIAQGIIQSLNLDNNGNPQMIPVAGPTIVRGSNHFWNDGEEWNPNLTILPASPSAFHTLQLADFIALNLQASEVEGIIDRAVLTVIVIAIIAAVVVILAALIVAIVLIIMVTYGVAIKVIVATLGIMSAVFTALSGVFFPIIAAAVNTIFSVQPAGLLVASALPVFSGAELMYRLSPVHYHRVLWVQERPPMEVAPGMTMTRTTTLGDQNLTERYRCAVPGAIYALTVTLDLLG